MRTLRILMLITLVAMMFMTMTGISSCRGSQNTIESLNIFEVENDYFLDWEGEGWDWGQMGASIIEHDHEVQVVGNPVSVSNLSWHISNPNVLTIDSSGWVIPHSAGYVSVYATFAGLTSNTVHFTVEEMPQELTVLSVDIQSDYIVDSVRNLDGGTYDWQMYYYDYACFRAIATYSDFSTADVTEEVATVWSLDSGGECLSQDESDPWCVMMAYQPGSIQQYMNLICSDEIRVEYTYRGKMVWDADTIGVFDDYPGE